MEYVAGILVGVGVGVYFMRKKFERELEVLYNGLQETCRNRQITLQGIDPTTGETVGYTIDRILDEVIEQM